MAMYDTSEFKAGLKLVIDGDPYTVVENEFVKPGKGQAFNRVKIRNLKNGRTIERTYKSGESVEGADIVETDAQYLYNDGAQWHFMNTETFDQFIVDDAIMDDAKLWIKEQDVCVILLWNDLPLSVTPPNVVVLRIVETDPGLKGDTSGGGGKPATLETGAVIRVPLFVQTNELIKVNTKTREYLSRVKE